jgi:hypothetical protein
MDAIKKPTTRTNCGARSNVIAMPARELPKNWYNVAPDLPTLRALTGVRP